MADNDLVLTITANASGVQPAVANIKTQIDSLSQSATAAANKINTDLSSAVEKLQTQSAKQVPQKNAGLDPAQVWENFKALREIYQELNAFGKSLYELSDEEKRTVADKAAGERTELEIKRQVVALQREKLLVGKSEAEQQRLREQWAAQDAKTDREELARLQDKYKAAQEIVKAYEEWAERSKANSGIISANAPLPPDPKKVKEARATMAELDAVNGKGLADIRIRTEVEQATAELRHKQLQQALLQESVRAHLAQIEAQKTADDAKLQRDQQTIQALHSQHVISDEDELTLLRATINKKYTEEGEYLQKKLAQFQRVNNTGQIAAVNAQILSLQARQDSELIKLDNDYYQQVEKNGQRAVDAAAARNKKILADLRAAREQTMQAVAETEKVQDQVEEQAVEQRFLRGKITRQQEITEIAALKRDELQIEINFLKDKEKLYQGDANKIREIEQQITKLQGQQLLIRAKAVTDSLKAEEKEYQQLWKSIGSTFKSTIDGLLQGNETIAQAFQKLYTGLLQDLINYEAQRLEVKAASWIKDHILHIAHGEAAIDAESGITGAAAFADSASTGPAGLAAAPAVAAGAVTATQGFKALLLETGAWNIPYVMPAILHPGEMVVPAFPAGLMRNAFQAGSGVGNNPANGGGITVMVNHSVNAIDAASFQTTIKRHGNIIGNEVARVLKLKGFGGK